MDYHWLAFAITATATPESIAGRLALEYLAGDDYAGLALSDWTLENNVNHSPFKIGEKILVFTVTLYYVGEVTEIGLGWIRMKEASWVHWTARLGSLVASSDLTRNHGGRKPRTEYLGDHTILTQSIVSFVPWHGNLPRESLS